MEQEWHIIAWFAATRTVHFFACLLVFGVCVFDRFVVAAAPWQEQVGIRQRWRSIARTLVLLALPAALISGASWFILVVIQMSGLPPGEAVHLDVLRLVWDETQFGGLWRLRTVLWLSTTAMAVPLIVSRHPSLPRGALAWLALALSGLLAASLAWSGHGQTGGPVAWHILADVLHILVIGFWPIGLLPLALLLFATRKPPTPDKWLVLSVLVRRFSATSLVSVALLAASGLGNSWFLVGSFSNLVGTTYGRILLIKIGIFSAMVAIGAVNLLYLKPRLSLARADAEKESAAARLRFNLLAEIAFGSAVMIIIGILGQLPPATEPTHPPHHHHPIDEAAKASDPSWIIAELSIVKYPHRSARWVAAKLAVTRATDIAACRFRGALRRESNIEDEYRDAASFCPDRSIQLPSMPRRARMAPGGLVYHVLNRSVGKMKMFRRDGDYDAFARVIAEARERHPIRILSLCVMPTHWHFVVWPEGDGELTDFFRWLAHTHAMRWRTSHHTVGYGHLYQGRFKSFPVQSDAHLRTVCRYVERNPLTGGLVSKAEQWKWSSLWIRAQGTDQQRALLSRWPVPLPSDWTARVNAPITDQERLRINTSITRGSPFGDDEWVRQTVRRLHLEHTVTPEGRPRKRLPGDRQR